MKGHSEQQHFTGASPYAFVIETCFEVIKQELIFSYDLFIGSKILSFNYKLKLQYAETYN